MADLVAMLVEQVLGVLREALRRLELSCSEVNVCHVTENATFQLLETFFLSRCAAQKQDVVDVRACLLAPPHCVSVDAECGVA